MYECGGPKLGRQGSQCSSCPVPGGIVVFWPSTMDAFVTVTSLTTSTGLYSSGGSNSYSSPLVVTSIGEIGVTSPTFAITLVLMSPCTCRTLVDSKNSLN